ncbi:hypothetical protein PPYR_01986 [Photinus pyralis]|uniref:Cilia- and flagella-associated protein 263 n=4 Tax=Photinus pyralis TaxID=7054 RepID=A0A5N4B630_PHOPY|nr:hypothetical protein PPYR_01986 [Photinus pyralis]
MTQILELANKMQQTQTHPSQLLLNGDRRETTDSIRGTSSRHTDSMMRFATTTTSTGDKGPRVNLSQRTDLALKELENIQTSLTVFLKQSHRTKCNLKAKLEELNIQQSEVEDARNIFQQTVVVEGVDPLTQRIPAEKFIRYMEEWLRSAELTIEKMRLKTCTLKAMYSKLSHQLIQKEELGETIDAVDFEQLRIQNNHLAKTIEEKNAHLLDLKKMNGMSNLVLSTNKKYLQKQMAKMKSMKQSINTKKERIINLDSEYKEVETQVAKEKEKYQKIQHLTQHYTVPDTMDYIKTNIKLLDLRKQMKMWERRNYVQQFVLNTCIHQMKNLTGSKEVRPWWFEKRTKSNCGEE